MTPLPATPGALGAIQRASAAKGLDWRPLASVAQYESGLNPRALGDGGHAFGLFQNNNAGGTITGDPHPQRFFDPNVSAGYTANAISRLSLQGKTPEQQIHDIVYRYERPADMPKEYAAALSIYRTRYAGLAPQARAPGAAALPAATVPGAGSPLGTQPQPSAPAAPPMPNFAPLQAGFALSQQSNQRALDALGAISGQQRTAPSAPDFSALTQAQQSQLQPTQVPLQPTHVTVPLKGATPPGLDPQATKAVELARHYIGTPYHFGGASPGAGFDCSGLIQYTMGQLGIKIPRTAAEQYKTGTPVQTNQLQPGDALYFSSSGGITHTGMYVGNGQFIEAPHTGDVVKIVPLTGAYQQQLVGARRFTKGTTAPTTPTQTQPTQPTTPTRSGGGYTVGNFEGTQVASWMVPALQFARQHGWSGTLTSGLRSTELQKQLYARYQAGGNIAAKPGQSNHEIQNGGAFDATDPETLHKILQAYKGQRPIWAMSVGLQDHPHFSLNGH